MFCTSKRVYVCHLLYVYLSTKRYGEGKDRKEDLERKSKSTFHPSYSKSITRIPPNSTPIGISFSVSFIVVDTSTYSYIYTRMCVCVCTLERGERGRKTERRKRGQRTMRNDSCGAPARFRPIDNFFQTRFTPTLREKCGEDTRDWSSG